MFGTQTSQLSSQKSRAQRGGAGRGHRGLAPCRWHEAKPGLGGVRSPHSSPALIWPIVYLPAAAIPLTTWDFCAKGFRKVMFVVKRWEKRFSPHSSAGSRLAQCSTHQGSSSVNDISSIFLPFLCSTQCLSSLTTQVIHEFPFHTSWNEEPAPQTAVVYLPGHSLELGPTSLGEQRKTFLGYCFKPRTELYLTSRCFLSN